MKNKKIADCEKIEKLIPLYLENKLSAADMNVLLEHIKNCKNCREELTIQYMVSEGLTRAEEENDYDLLKGLNNRIEESKRQIKTHDFLYTAFIICMIVIVLIVLLSFITIIL